MSKLNEIEVYDKSQVSVNTGEIEDWDEAIFPYVIRKRIIDLIKVKLHAVEPKIILDYGCGAGWLSISLSKWGFEVVGIDLSAHLIKNAKLACPKAEFVICDCEKLPFRNAVFNLLIGISILHHLNLKRSLIEIKRVLLNEADFIFEEPNLLNPFSGIGRKLFPMSTHSKGEKPFIPKHLKTTLNKLDFKFIGINYLFFIAFPVSRILKVTKIKLPFFMVKIFSLFERIMEKMPYIKQLNSSLVIFGKIHK
jgi:ubiquinone/menaquinone biosynthesis C-methylase UbiE